MIMLLLTIFFKKKKLVVAQCSTIYKKKATKIMYIIDLTTILDQIKNNQKHKKFTKKKFISFNQKQ
jgi:hypothetical protein